MWRMHVRAPYAELLVAGSKAVDVRAAYPSRRGLTSGHLIWFDTDHPVYTSITAHVQHVTFYPSVECLLDREDPVAIAGPGATREGVAALLGDIYPDAPPRYLAIDLCVLDLVIETTFVTRSHVDGTAGVG
jgi:ASC-1-like (ASCH) protein